MADTGQEQTDTCPPLWSQKQNSFVAPEEKQFAGAGESLCVMGLP